MSPSESITPPSLDTSVIQVAYTLVSALTAARKAQSMTQAELAHRAGLSRMTVQRLESNGLDPRISTLQEMARALEQEFVVIPSRFKKSFEQWLKECSQHCA
ncbi:MAG: helix-turn-helix transcriptional regulator [Comamonas sp.]|nr:helix-turn-helix transcriptional regulator [Comamonas sp.]